LKIADYNIPHFYLAAWPVSSPTLVVTSLEFRKKL